MIPEDVLLSATLQIPTPKPTLDIRWVWIDPERARFILDNYNKHNRKDSGDNEAKIVSHMVNGTFFDVGDTIKFDENGLFRDGQNRLNGVVKSGIGRWFLVVGNMPAKAAIVLNAGKPSSPADSAQIHFSELNLELTNGRRQMSVARMVALWDGGNYLHVAQNGQIKYVTQPEQLAWVNDNFALSTAACTKGRGWTEGFPGVSDVVLSFAWVLFQRYADTDTETASDFFQSIKDHGKGIKRLSTRSPRYKYVSMLQARQKVGLSWHPARELGALILTWNAEATGSFEYPLADVTPAGEIKRKLAQLDRDERPTPVPIVDPLYR